MKNSNSPQGTKDKKKKSGRTPRVDDIYAGRTKSDGHGVPTAYSYISLRKNRDVKIRGRSLIYIGKLTKEQIAVVNALIKDLRIENPDFRMTRNALKNGLFYK